MLYTAEKQPAAFFATCARLIGPEVKLTIEQSLPGNLSPSDWADLRELLSAIRSALPMPLIGPPARFFRYALAALRDCPEILILNSCRSGHYANRALAGYLTCSPHHRFMNS